MSLIVIWLGWTPHTLTPGSRGAWWGSGASAVCFGDHFIKQKLQGTSKLVGVGHLIVPQIRILKDLGQCASGAMVPHSQGEFIK